MGIVSLAEDSQGLTAMATKATEEEVESELGEICLDESAEIDANILDDPESNIAVCRTTHPVASPTFTRSWSFTAPAQERKVTLAVVTTRNSNLKIDVSRALARSWSFTRTRRSPSPQEGSNCKVWDMISLKECKESLGHDVEEFLNVESPMPSIREDEEDTTVVPESPMPSVNEYEDDARVSESEATVQDPEVTNAYKVRPLSRSFVVPSEPTEAHWLPLSNLDRVVNPTFSSVIHYYQNAVNEQRSFGDVTELLKETLAKTLVDFYPLAGRLSLRDDDGKVDLHCNDAGAVWIEAAVDAELKDIGGAKPNHLLSGLDVARVGPGPLYIPDQIMAMPVLIIQATKFTCGTVAIATSWHHTVADGFSGTHFMRSWGEVALGKPISLKPVHTRPILKARDPPNPTLVNGYSTRSIDELYCQGPQASTAAPAQLAKFDLGKEAIAELKTQANLEPPPFTPRPYTSAESISGHLWKQMTKARATANSYNAELAKDQTTKFFMFVDGRKRLRLPGGYFGNVVCSACAVAKEADILINPLHYATSLIRTATRNITEEYFRSLIDWVELQGMSGSKSEHVNSLGHDVAATFWTFFPLYEIDFGWGKPVFAARNSPPRPFIDGIAMMPHAEGKGMVALLNLHSDRMSKLQRQISFATVFNS